MLICNDLCKQSKSSEYVCIICTSCQLRQYLYRICTWYHLKTYHVKTFEVISTCAYHLHIISMTLKWHCNHVLLFRTYSDDSNVIVSSAHYFNDIANMWMVCAHDSVIRTSFRWNDVQIIQKNDSIYWCSILLSGKPLGNTSFQVVCHLSNIWVKWCDLYQIYDSFVVSYLHMIQYLRNATIITVFSQVHTYTRWATNLETPLCTGALKTAILKPRAAWHSSGIVCVHIHIYKYVYIYIHIYVWIYTHLYM